MSDVIEIICKDLYNYAERKHSNGEVELANGILKAKCYIEDEKERYIELTKKPQECKWTKGINSVETCWGDIDIKTFNKFKRQGAKFCPYCGRKIKV